MDPQVEHDDGNVREHIHVEQVDRHKAGRRVLDHFDEAAVGNSGDDPAARAGSNRSGFGGLGFLLLSRVAHLAEYLVKGPGHGG